MNRLAGRSQPRPDYEERANIPRREAGFNDMRHKNIEDALSLAVVGPHTAEDFN